MSFSSLGLLDALVNTANELGYQTPTAIQQKAIPIVLQGRDLLAAAQTGTGKTAAFTLPLLHKLSSEGPAVGSNQVRCLILVPTRELAEQVLSSVQTYGRQLPLTSYAVYGGVSINPQILKLRQGIDVLVATPGRLADLHRQNAVRFDKVQLLVLDEADRMLDLGFALELAEILADLPRKRQSLLFSATFSDEIRTLANKRLNNPLTVEVSPRNTAAQTVKQWLIPVDKKRKAELLLHLLAQRPNTQLLVFVKTRKGTEHVGQLLREAGLKCDTIHGDKPQPARTRALQAFRDEALQVLVATDVAARGLDIPDLPLVINHDLPTVAEDYIHRIGRSGRAGSQGEAISLVCADEVEQLAAIEQLLKQTLPRQEEPNFSPAHRVPLTQDGIVQAKPKTKKPKHNTNDSMISAAARLGTWFGESPKPARAGRSKANAAKKPSTAKNKPKR
ncbi:DEAD/DEAH box helicase [Atopomonas sediminilitoris]|uniref:DEAD/DEAH box helicase n=1 Tax=Atopomonas sediminilitoris TaxID=2919919 RepID=UPI001F4DE68C|nr:DEAD/DEAH box helicase [Atopomonas sediminilitoris]MCJ8170236.1 DEAD/DEAH box helicase [Atopomonas sediminilitoris]